MDISLRRATPADAPMLAEMNRQLIEDEGSRNPMTEAELAARLRTWLQTDWSAGLIFYQVQVIGYVLYQECRDEYFPGGNEIYVRQFFIKPDYRGKGFGRSAFKQIVTDWFSPDAAITLEVLETNPSAQQFWQQLGFKPYCTTLKLERPGGSL